MHKPTLHCFGGSWGENDPLRERRVVWEDGTNKAKEYKSLPSPDTDPEKRKLLQEQNAAERNVLNDAIRSSRDERVRKLDDDSIAKRRAQGLVKTTEGDVIIFHEGLHYSEHHEVGREILEARHDIEKDLAEDAGVALKRIEEALKAIGKQQEALQKAGGQSLPQFEEMKEKIKGLQKKKLDDVIRSRTELLRSTEQGKSEVDINEFLQKSTFSLLEEEGLLLEVQELLKELNTEIEEDIDARFPHSNEYRKNVAGKEIARSIIATEMMILVGESFSDGGSFNVDKLAELLSGKGVDMNEEKKMELRKALGLQSLSEFTTSVRGRQAVVEFAKDRDIAWNDDGVIGLAYTLLTEGSGGLERNDLWKEAMRNESFRENQEEARRLLREAWDPSILVAYLERSLHPGKNPPGFSIRQLWLRSQFPDGMTEDLEKADLLDIGVSTVVKLGKLWDEKKKWIENEETGEGKWEAGFKSMDAVIDVVLEECLKSLTKNGVIRYRLNREALERILGFLHFGGDAQAREEARKFVEDNFPQSKNTADNRVYLKNAGDEGDLMTREELKDKIKAWLGREGEKIGENIRKYLPKVVVGSLSGFERTNLVFQELGELAVVGSKSWWGYAREIPRNVTYGDFEKKTLLPLLDRRRALRQYGTTLQDLSETLSESNNIVSSKREQIVELKRMEREKRERPSSALDERTRLQQAREFLGDFAYVYHILKPLWTDKSAFEQDVSLWLGMRKDIETATDYLEAGDKKNDKLKKLSEEERADLNSYLLKLKHLAEEEGTNILLPLKHRHGITVHHLAHTILGSKREGKGSLLEEAPLDIWLTERSRSEESLKKILVDAKEKPGAAKALITAFVNPEGGPVSYSSIDANGANVDVSISPEEAFREIVNIRNDLERKIRAFPEAEKQLNDRDRFLNPLDRGVRVGVEMLQDMWAGDWVDKGKVVAIVLAGIWVLRDQWAKGGKEGEGWRRALLAGIPLLMAGNEMYKKQTGRDFLGEKLFYLSREERSTALEKLRREQAGIERFEMLQTPAGQAALRELMDSDDPITIKELLDWRTQVSANGKKIYEQGAPDNLSASRIRQHLGSAGTKEDAHKLAYTVFESQCAKIAFDNNLGTDLDTQIALGATLIEKRYVIDAPTGVEATMLDVLIGESTTPQLDGAIARGRETPVEWLLERGSALSKRALTEAEIAYVNSKAFTKDQIAKIPELWAEGKEFVLRTSDDVWNYLRVTYAKLRQEVPADVRALWTLTIETAKSAGLVVKTRTPGAIEWTLDTGTAATEATKEKVMNFYRWMKKFSVPGDLILALEEFYRDVFKDDIEVSLEDLTSIEQFKSDIITQLSKVTGVPPEFGKWIEKWVENINPAAEKPHEKILNYEQMRRMLYSTVIAARVKAVHDSQGRVMPSRLNIDWVPAVKAFEPPPLLQDLYAYIYDQYGSDTISTEFIGIERTVAGEIEQYGGRKTREGATYVGGAVDFFHAIIDPVTRQQASEYLKPQVESFIHPILAEAEEAMTPDQYKHFEQYLRTFVTNRIIAETLGASISKEAYEVAIDKPAYLMLTKKQGQNMYHALNRDKLALDIVALRKLSRLSDFKGPTNAVRVPFVIQKVRDTLGTVPAATPGGPSAQPTLPPLHAAEFLIPALDSLSNEEKALDALDRLTDENKKNEIRAKFDEKAERDLPKIVASLDLKENEKQMLFRLLRGVSEKQRLNVEGKILPYLNSVERLSELAHLRERARPEQLKNIQHCLDRAVLNILKNAIDDLSQKYPMNKRSDLQSLSKSQREELTAPLLNLYYLSHPGTNETSDIISEAMEYMLYAGENTKRDAKGKSGFEKYEENLKDLQKKYIPPIPVYPDTPPQSEKYGGEGWLDFAVKGSRRRMSEDLKGNVDVWSKVKKRLDTQTDHLKVGYE